MRHDERSESPSWCTHTYLHTKHACKCFVCKQGHSTGYSSMWWSEKHKNNVNKTGPQREKKDKMAEWICTWLRPYNSFTLSSSLSLSLCLFAQLSPHARPSLWDYTLHTCDFTPEVVIKANHMWESCTNGDVSNWRESKYWQWSCIVLYKMFLTKAMCTKL